MSDNLPAKINPAALVEIPEGLTWEKTVELVLRRHEEITAYREVQETLMSDLELALNIIISMQQALKMLGAPDRDIYRSKDLLHKYNMEHVEPHPNFRIYLDGRDITTHPDSIPGTAEDELQLEEGSDA